MTETSAPQHTLAPIATPTPEPPKRALTICTGSEPASLFLYGDRSSSAENIWQVIYGGKIDSQNSRLLKETPSQANGAVKLVPVEVKSGDLIVDANGEWAELKEGVKYRPSGCTANACEQAYTGSDPVTVDQMSITFNILPGLTWSDGSALTADDSVYSFEIAKSLYPAALPEIVAETGSYRAVDETTLEWAGVPGFVGGRYLDFFFSPLPRHAWGLINPKDLAQSPLASQTPLGWGPFAITEWVAGDHITLNKNPKFSGASQGLPRIDKLVFRFTSSGKDALDALLAGECDLADQTTGLETLAPQLQELESSGKIKSYTLKNAAWEQILFNTAPADPKQPVFFGQKEVRQAIAYCIDRQGLVNSMAAGNGQIANSYIPPENPLYNPEAAQYPTDIEKGSQLLAAAGWVDADNDPATPRIAQGVKGLPDGTPFTVTSLAADDKLSQTEASIVKESLAKCGIQVNVQAMKWEDLLASGPEGPVFGRHFDLTQFAWALAPDQTCRLFLSSQVPGPYPEFSKGWGGANAGGYQNESYDAACQAALTSLPDSPAYLEAQKQAQAVFSQDLPALPLSFPTKLLASRPDFCGITTDSSSEGFVLNIEELDYAEGCQ